jgi:hypothetical protein
MLMGLPRWLSAAMGLAVIAGCQTEAQFVEFAPIVPHGVAYVDDSNPVFIPLGPTSYGQVFECCLQVLGDYGFELREQNRYGGHIETVPRVSPGLLLFLKPGSPDLRDRLLSTLQTYRHRVELDIQPAENGGFFVKVTAYKELEDLPRPVRSTVGGAIFHNENNVERQFEVIDPTLFEQTWIFRGFDHALEQEIIRRLKRCM